MISKLQNPYTAAVMGIVFSVVAGVFMCLRLAEPLIQAAAAVVKPKVVTEENKLRGWDFWTIEIENLSAELREERSRLRKQAELLDQRAIRVATEEKELGKVREDIEAMRRDISRKVVEIGVDESKNLRALSQTYSNLSPRAAVAIIRELDDATVVKILSLMKADVVSAIFEEMSATPTSDGTLARRAALLSEKLRLMKSAKASTTS